MVASSLSRSSITTPCGTCGSPGAFFFQAIGFDAIGFHAIGIRNRTTLAKNGVDRA